jgi:hypothetical protein
MNAALFASEIAAVIKEACGFDIIVEHPCDFADKMVAAVKNQYSIDDLFPSEVEAMTDMLAKNERLEEDLELFNHELREVRAELAESREALDKIKSYLANL